MMNTSSLNHIPTYRYAASVLQEIKDLVYQVKHPESTKLVFQTLPKHMRRRAMSHHPKRLPRKYREAHRAQMSKSGKPKSTKRPSRKYRRRPRNLLLVYERRQREHKWLETHLWHARRFHMINRWGYRLAYASCDKTFRACYRASAQHCLVQDISYMACIEMQGQMVELSKGFKRLTSDYDNITGRRFTSGRFEGCLYLFKDGSYPNDALCKVNFMWKPAAKGTDKDEPVLWLWVHPAVYDLVLSELIKVFDLLKSKKIESDDTSPRKSSPPCYENCKARVKLIELKDTLLRFRLTGGRSQAVLSSTLKAYELINKESNSKIGMKSQDEVKSNWIQDILAEDSSGTLEAIHEQQVSVWKRLIKFRMPTMMPSNCIVGLNAIDPRINRPKKRSKAEFEGSESDQMLPDYVDESFALYTEFMSQTLSHSHLWQPDIRDRVTRNMLSIHKYNELRTKHVAITGSSCYFETALQPVPIILIQRPGAQDESAQRLGYGSGWDIIAPGGYAMAIWQSLVMWGAKAGGLRESESIARESGMELHHPDTVIGKRISSESYTTEFGKYFRRPPNRRHNYRKLSIISPFRAPLSELVNDWRPTAASTSTGNANLLSYYILRNPKALIELNSLISKGLNFDSLKNLPDDNYNFVVPVRIVAVGRGKIDNHAIICLPLREDISRFQKFCARSLRRQAVHLEPKRIDSNEAMRKKLVQEHGQRLKRLRRSRVKEKRLKQRTSTTKVKIRPANTSPVVSEHFRKMCRLWLPDDYSEQASSVRKQCSREVVGYITSGGQSFVEGRGAGCGFVAIEGFKALLEANRGIQQVLRGTHCLVRNTKSRNYYLAKVTINTSQ